MFTINLRKTIILRFFENQALFFFSFGGLNLPRQVYTYPERAGIPKKGNTRQFQQLMSVTAGQIQHC